MVHHPVYCENVTFRNVTVHSGADGIDVDSCKNVVIDGCQFEARDDCISLKSGRGFQGNAIAIPCEDVYIANCTFNDAILGLHRNWQRNVRGCSQCRGGTLQVHRCANACHLHQKQAWPRRLH